MSNLIYLAQGRFLPTLHKPHLISCRYLFPPAPSSLLLPPLPSSLLAQFNFQPWYFFLARDNLRWKQFHRLVTHQVIIISIRAPGARAEGTEERVDPARQRTASLDGEGRCGRTLLCFSLLVGVSQGPEFSDSLCLVSGKGQAWP